MKHLYSDFLKDKKVHNLNEAFYKKRLKAVTGSQPASYFKKVYGNGQKIYDDHIFSTMYNDRILQVIQLEPVSEQPFLKARVQKWDNQYDMLVLSLELSDAVKPELEKIIRAWLVEGSRRSNLMRCWPGKLQRAMVPELLILAWSMKIHRSSFRSQLSLSFAELEFNSKFAKNMMPGTIERNLQEVNANSASRSFM